MQDPTILFSKSTAKRFFSQTKDINAMNISEFYENILYITFSTELDYHYYCEPISTGSCATHCHRTLQTVEFKMLPDTVMDENNKGLLSINITIRSRNPKSKTEFTTIVIFFCPFLPFFLCIRYQPLP